MTVIILKCTFDCLLSSANAKLDLYEHLGLHLESIQNFYANKKLLLL